jgi:pyrroloquinoline quinone biosynthesis protein B
LALTGDGESWVLVNASPDIGQQIRNTPVLWPKEGLRHSPISAVVLTSAEIDHSAGLLTLRERQPFKLLASEAVLAVLAENPLFGALRADTVDRQPMRPGERIEFGGLALELLIVPGKAPLFLEGPAPKIGTEGGEAVALAVESRGARMIYMPGCADLTPATISAVSGADIVMFDGTTFTDDELLLAGVGTRTGRRMGHVPITGEGGSLAMLARRGGRRTVYVHINNTNPMLIEGSPERRLVEEAGIEVAYDGMEIAL